MFRLSGIPSKDNKLCFLGKQPIKPSFLLAWLPALDLEHKRLWNKNGLKGTWHLSSTSIWKGKKFYKEIDIPKSHHSPYLNRVLLNQKKWMKGTPIPHLAKKSTWERLFFYPNRLLPSNKIEGKHRDCQAETAHCSESQRCGVIRHTKNFTGISAD